MSFSISFTASSISIARRKVNEAYAPAAIKALIEKCLDALSYPVQSGVTQAAVSVRPPDEAKATQTSGVRVASSPLPPPRLLGVHVEAWGHIGDPGDHGKAWIDRFVVQPLFE